MSTTIFYLIRDISLGVDNNRKGGITYLHIITGCVTLDFHHETPTYSTGFSVRTAIMDALSLGGRIYALKPHWDINMQADRYRRGKTGISGYESHRLYVTQQLTCR